MDQKTLMELQRILQESKRTEEKVRFIDEQIVEMNSFRETLSDVGNEDNEEFLSPLGKGVFVKSVINDRKLFVDAGSGVFVRKTPFEAREIVEQQLEKLELTKLDTLEKLEDLQQELNELVGGASGN